MDVLSLLKQTVQGVISGNNQIPDDKKSEAVSATTSALTEGFRNNLSLDNLSDITSLFGSGSSGGSSAGSLTSNPVVKNIISTVVQALVSKVGLSKGTADNVGSSVVQTVIKSLTSKANDPEEKGIDLESIIGTLGGGGKSTGSSGGSIMDTIGSLGKLFGK